MTANDKRAILLNMSAKTLAAVLLAAVLFSSKKDSTPGGKPPGKKKSPLAAQPAPSAGGVLLVGDSQSVAATSPGRRLAALLTKAGKPTRVIAKGGETASYFVGKGGGAGELARELSHKPAWVIVFLGSNEGANVARTPAMKPAMLKAHQRLKAIIDAAGAKALFVGPPMFGEKVRPGAGGRPINEGAAELVAGWQSIYNHFIDARPLTPEHTGVHFFGKGEAAAFAAALAPAVLGVL